MEIPLHEPNNEDSAGTVSINTCGSVYGSVVAKTVSFGFCLGSSQPSVATGGRVGLA